MLLQVKNIEKRYGDRVILAGAGATFARGDRVGLVGRNGCGKTTLCRIILGEESPDGGEVVRGSDLRLGYLEQQPPYGGDETVIGFLERYSGREEWHCAKVAGGFQLKDALLERRVAALPGGLQARVKLSAMLLGDPNFLVLDEPTNYLDLRTLLLLERFLKGYRGGYIVVSHDRAFLARTCSSTLEVERGSLRMYPRDIYAYLEHKALERDQAERFNRNVEAKRKHLQAFVDRNRVRASTASRAQSKLKQLDRLETVEIESAARAARIKLPPVAEKKGVALRCEDLAVGYPDKVVAEGIRFEIERGQHVAILGDNGEGKTTFLRTISGELPPRAGEFRWGHQLEAAYYAQHVYSALDPRKTVLEQLETMASPDTTQQDLLDMAGSFLFSDVEREKRIAVLSGGERARVCLAGLLLARRPVLLLDEPTNHLDFETVDALAQALEKHRGTVFFISHERSFVERVATAIVEVRQGAVTLYPADYASYLYATEEEIDRALGERPAAAARSAPARETGQAPSDHEARKLKQSRVRKLRKEIEAIERETSAREKERDTLHRHFLDHPLDPAPAKVARIAELGELLAASEGRWFALQEELEALEAELGDA